MGKKVYFMEELQEAYDASNGEWQFHQMTFEFPGVTEEMFIWFHTNLDDDLYRMWCPGAHRSYRKMTYQGVHGEVVEEATVPGYEPDRIILRHPPIEKTLFVGMPEVSPEHYNCTEAIDLEGRTPVNILHERFPYPDKLVIRNSIFLPKALSPDKTAGFLSHQKAEYRFHEFLPEIYRKRTWMVAN